MSACSLMLNDESAANTVCNLLLLVIVECPAGRCRQLQRCFEVLDLMTGADDDSK
jgi:hypothetical protein